MSFLHLNTGRDQMTYKVHPVVVFSILDHHKRRKEDQERVVGTLLGEVVGKDVLIRNCFPIPHSEKEDQVTIDMEYHKNMLELHKRVNAKDVVVGWYSTSDRITYISSLIHQLYEEQCQRPVHLTVDVSLANWKMGIKAYVGKEITVGDEKIMARFDNAKLELHAYEAEKIGVDSLINSTPDDEEKLDAPATTLTDFENLELSLSNLLHNIEVCAEYVDKVAEGKIKGDEELGRAIEDALNAVPRVESDGFEKLLNNNLQDILMVMYLANLTRAQLTIADRIQGLL